MCKFRNLKASEIDVRVARVNKGGVELLLYKNARVDMAILDETVGPLNWQRHHNRDNANCVVAIWDDSKSQWIEKEDTGVESNTEAEKGLASDSFKRACTNWGIGRELYTAPRIFCNSDVNIRDGKCYDRFMVESIEIKDGEIVALRIINLSNFNNCVFSWTKYPKHATENSVKKEKPVKLGKAAPEDIKVDVPQINELKKELARTGVGVNPLLRNYGKESLVDLSVEEYINAMAVLKKKPNKKEKAS